MQVGKDLDAYTPSGKRERIIRPGDVLWDVVGAGRGVTPALANVTWP